VRKRTREIDEKSLSELRRAARSSGNSAVMLRARAVLAFFDGASYLEIKSRMGLAGTTVAKWMGRFREQGVEGLRGEPLGPRSAPQREQVLAWLPQVIHQPPRSLGLREDRWTLRALQQVCQEQTGQRHSLESIRVALHRLGHSWKRAKQTITSPDAEYEGKRGR
jgi:transposase